MRSYRPGPGPVGIGSFDPISAKLHRTDQEAVALRASGAKVVDPFKAVLSRIRGQVARVWFDVFNWLYPSSLCHVTKAQSEPACPAVAWAHTRALEGLGSLGLHVSGAPETAACLG